MSTTNKRKMAGGRSGDRLFRAACGGNRPLRADRLDRLREQSGNACPWNSAARAVRSVRARWAGRAARAGKSAAYCICFACLLCCTCLTACSQQTKPGQEAASRLRLVSWNVQTFFDAERAGTEYKEFTSPKNWGEEAYRTRLKRLCDSLAVLHADVLVLQEIENEAVLHDISNFLCAQSFLGRRYRWAAFTREKGAALGCAVLSRWPLDTPRCHGIDLRWPQLAKPGLRPL
ncbi:MAG: hypothetical protein J6Y13_07080, partial [Treponema sp.]|nr:hypothetical protein [Treponema sp.]